MVDGPKPGSREFDLESALVRLLVSLGEPCPEGFKLRALRDMYGDAITEAVEALGGPDGEVIASNVPCDGCDGHGYIVTAPDGDGSRDWIERCDECHKFPGDEDAAVAMAKATGQLLGFARADCTFGDVLRPFIVAGAYVGAEDR